MARTWLVENDGTGDFTTIYDAMVACTKGDTVLIGPGRFDDMHEVVAPTWTSEAVFQVFDDSLTIIGSGRDETIVGPEVYTPGTGPHYSSVCISLDTLHVRLVDIGFENMWSGVHWPYGRLEIQGCRFSGHKKGLYLYCEQGAEVQDSEFYSDVSTAAGASTYPPGGPVEFVNCTFDGPGINETAIYFSTSNVNLVRGCQFYSYGGVAFVGASGLVEDCTAHLGVALALYATTHAEVEIRNSNLSGTFACLYADTRGRFWGSGNKISGGEGRATIFLSSESTIQLDSSDILKSGDYAVQLEAHVFPEFVQDLRNNWWGTADTDSISAMIYDGADDPSIYSVVDFLPVAGGPLPTTSESFGSVKSMFR